MGLLDIGRTVWHTFEPEALAVSVPVLSALLLWTPWRHLGRLLLTLFAIALVALVLLPIPQYLARGLEDRYPVRDSLPEDVDAAIVLAGDEPDTVAAFRRAATLEESGERIVMLVALAVRYPDLPLAFSGAREPRALIETLRLFGLPAERVMIDTRARRTADSPATLAPLVGRRVVLVTSALHMPRAMAVFEAAGWQPVAWPVDFRTGPIHIPVGLPARFSHQLMLLGDAMHEWIGLAAYRLAGRTADLLP